MRIAICDDEPVCGEQVKKALNEIYKDLDASVDVFTDPQTLTEAAFQKAYRLVILDIEMPGMNGLETAKKLRSLGENTDIVFLTSHIEYVLEGYEARALRYMLKPIQPADLSEIISYIQKQDNLKKHILINHDGLVSNILLSEITYMEADNQNVAIHTGKEVYTNRYNLSDYEAELTESGFFRIHRSYLLNLSYLRKIDRRDAELTTGERLPISRTKQKQLRDALYHYVMENSL